MPDYWKAVESRDAEYDGQFVYAVQSTGVYCRPSCPSRRPRRDLVRFFATPQDAETAGFRPCRRCQPDQAAPDEPHLDLIQQICRYLDEPHETAPTLAELAERFNLSPYHLQRTFKRIVGITPRQYAVAHRFERFKDELKDGKAITDALYEAGFNSSSSLYDQAGDQLGMSPRLYQKGGEGMWISYAIVPCKLGWLLVAATEKGLCAVRLGDSERELEETLSQEFPAAQIDRQESRWVAPLLDYLDAAQPNLDLPLDVQATAFQRRVWTALQAIPYGSTRSYQDIADAIGQPEAVRAVAHACATNPVALVIPCHRVVRKDGSLGGYRWGIERKRVLLETEAQAAVPAGRDGDGI